MVSALEWLLVVVVWYLLAAVQREEKSFLFVMSTKSTSSSKSARIAQSECFTKIEHIKCAADFKNLFKTGKRASVVGAKIFFLPNNLEFNRVGFPLPRGFGNAVQRNMAKRFSRESYRKLKSHLNTGFDILLLVYPNPENHSFLSRCEQFRTLFEKAGILKSECRNLSENS